MSSKAIILIQDILYVLLFVVIIGNLGYLIGVERKVCEETQPMMETIDSLKVENYGLKKQVEMLMEALGEK